ncbi:MAG: GAF domain-containing protein, partial [Chloroflexi bacterium]
ASLGTALDNARLFDEVQKRNREINEGLKQQTATSEVLRAMSGFQPDLRSLLEIIAENIAKVCDANDAHIYRVEGTTLKEWTHRGSIPGLEAGESLPLNRGSVIGRAIIDRHIIHIHDAQVELNESEFPVSVTLQRRWGYRTVLATPLLRDGEPIGGIAIRREEVEPFTDQQIKLVKTFADQAVIAIENVRLFDETQRLLKDTQQRNAELAIINKVQAGLASKLDLQAIYELMGETVRKVFNVQVMDIVAYDPATGLISMPYSYEKGDRTVFSPREPYGFRLHVIQSGEPLLINENFLELAEQFNNPLLTGAWPKSALFVPLLVEGMVKGIISIQDLDRENAYTPMDVRLLQTLVNSMSVAIENARLFDETQHLLKETEQRNAELAIINSVQEGLVAKMDIQGIYDLVGDKIREIFDAQVVLISIFDPTQEASYAPYVIEKGERLQLTPGPLTALERYIARTRHMFVCNENFAARAQELFGGVNVPVGESPKALLAMPLMVGEEVKGIISLQNVDHEHAFSELDVRLLATLANSMSVALENARLFDETQRLLKETKQRNAELAIINSVQTGLASKLEFQSIIDLVGDQVRAITQAK